MNCEKRLKIRKRYEVEVKTRGKEKQQREMKEEKQGSMRKKGREEGG